MMTIHVHITKRSSNKKTGAIPVTTTEASSCPPSCPFINGSCYAKSGFHLRMHWDKVSKGERGTDWQGLCNYIESLPHRQVWRHNQAGDIPHVLGMINDQLLDQLVTANTGKRGYTYTHHKLSPSNVKAIKSANERGFTINASCESLEQADEAIAKGLPAAVVIANDKEPPKTTPQGHRVMVCPAQTQEGMTCKQCKLCSVSNRRCVVAFLAHGNKAKEVNKALSN